MAKKHTEQSPAAGKPPRRTQTERSRSMRKRLLDATLDSLAEEGYNGSSLNAIVVRAGVSRGAQVHHYPNKQALMLDAAGHILHGIYKAWGKLLLSVSVEEDRLKALVQAMWRMYSTKEFRAYNELLLASQRDPALADAMHELGRQQVEIYKVAIHHYYTAAPGSKADIEALFVQLGALMHGFANHAHLLGPKAIPSQLQAWIDHAGPHLRARKGVHTPPPRPAQWDASH